ncbi:actin-like protein 6A [Oscarella lobularis]|uniref:actin-like protein 6A n=1 Tax=Oscarella lobularis TaxID=121494 RepID=UPI003313AA49
MSGGVYGGDEVGALVFDFGSFSTRAGYAGEDTPKVDFPSSIGILQAQSQPMETEDSLASTESGAKKYSVEAATSVPRGGIELNNFIKDGMIEDWDIFGEVVSHVYKRYFRCDAKEHPVMMSEASWNTRPKREKLTELMFEQYNVPAFFLCKQAVLTAFANGRSSGLIIDSGATQTAAVPVHDGYVLQQAIVRTPLAGDFVTAQCRTMFEEKQVEIVPSYLVASREIVKENERAKYKRKEVEVTRSFHAFKVKEAVHDFKCSICQVADGPFDETSMVNVLGTSYHFPNGYNSSFGVERFKPTEALFNATNVNLKGVHGTGLLGIPQVASTSAGMCDIDIRPGIYGGVILTGGNTLLNGFTDRLTRELTMRTPPTIKAMKVVSNNTSVERRFSSWIGGSVLASLGTFQQMWISQREYEEHGKTCVERKCP